MRGYRDVSYRGKMYHTGFVQIFSPPFSKTIISFSRHKVIEQVINTTLKKKQEESFFHDVLKRTRQILNKI